MRQNNCQLSVNQTRQLCSAKDSTRLDTNSDVIKSIKLMHLISQKIVATKLWLHPPGLQTALVSVHETWAYHCLYLETTEYIL